MCLGVPAQVVEIFKDSGPLKQGKVDFGGLCKSVALSSTPEAKVGDYVLVHVGFAISVIDEGHAETLLQLLDEERT